jgi:adenylate cyclase
MDNHARAAIAAALEMQSVHTALQAVLKAQGQELPSMGIGVSSGEVIAGEFGAANFTDFTAMGRVMNLGSRICGAADAGQVLISQTTYELAQDLITVNPLEPLMLKGISQPAPVYEVRSIYGG